MSRYIIENRLTQPEQLTAFNSEGYFFDEEASGNGELVFKRRGSSKRPDGGERPIRPTGFVGPLSKAPAGTTVNRGPSSACAVQQNQQAGDEKAAAGPRVPPALLAAPASGQESLQRFL